MHDPGLARRYAKALFQLARERSTAATIEGQLRSVVTILDENPALTEFLGTPRVSPEHKQETLRAVFGGRIEPLLTEFLLLIRRKGRFRLIHEVRDAFHKLVMIDRNATAAIVTTAIPLTDDERVRLSAGLQARVGRKIELTEAVDPAIIGGVVVRVGGHVYDDSIRHHLKMLREDLSRVSVHMTDEESVPATA